MARVPNFLYRGDDMGIGQGISNLGQALFGDPQAAAALETQKTQNEYTRSLMAEHQYNVEKERTAQARKDKASAAILKHWGLGGLFGEESGTPAQLMPPTMTASAPGGITATPLAPPAPRVLDAYAANLNKPAASPIQSAPLDGAPAAPLTPVSLAGSDMWNPDSYIAKMQQRESGGRAGAKNPNSSAYGLSQFTQGTWTDIGMPGTPQEATPEMYAEATRRLTERNRGQLTSYYGQAPDDAGVYTAHHYGVKGAERILNEAMDSPNTPINQLISPEAFAANRRELTNPDGSVKTVGQLMGEYQEYFRGNSPIQPIAPQGEAPSALAQTMTPDINTLSPQLQTAMPQPAMPQPSLDIQTAAGPAPAAPAPAAPQGPLPATTPTQDSVNAQIAQTAQNPAAQLAAATTPQPGALPGEQPQSGDPLGTFLDSLNDAEKAQVLMTMAAGGDVLDTLSSIAVAKAKLGGPAGAGQFASNAQDAERWNVLDQGNLILKQGGQLSPELRQQYIAAWAALSKNHTWTDADGQPHSEPAVDLFAYDYTPPPGIDPAVLKQQIHPTKPLSGMEQQTLAMASNAKQSLDAALASVGDIKVSDTFGMYQPDSAVGQAAMSWLAPENQAQASQIQNAINAAFGAISGKAVTEQEAERLKKAFMPVAGMNPTVAAQRLANLKQTIDIIYQVTVSRGRNGEPIAMSPQEREQALNMIEVASAMAGPVPGAPTAAPGAPNPGGEINVSPEELDAP